MSSTKTINGISSTEYNREYMRKYREKNRDKYNEYMKVYNLKNNPLYEEKMLKNLNAYLVFKKSQSKKN